MARFITRVELHDADDEDYETLHEAMEEEGFTRTIRSEKGEVFHLPQAEYDRRGDLNLKAVLDSAERAASKTELEYSIIVTKSAGRRWCNLSAA